MVVKVMGTLVAGASGLAALATYLLPTSPLPLVNLSESVSAVLTGTALILAGSLIRRRSVLK